MVKRNGELEHVHFVALDDVIQDRSGLNGPGFKQGHLSHALVIGLDDVRFPLVLKRQAQGQSNSFNGGELPV